MTPISPKSQPTDGELLERFVRDRSDEAFRTLSARYAGMVYGTCLRTLGREDLAEDAAQEVFLLLAKKARSLTRHPTLAGWLYVSARNVARDALRGERRRREVERRALRDHEKTARFNDVLDDGLARLGSSERNLIVLRFLRGESLAELASRLGVTEDAARMRVNRALESLRTQLVRSGLVIPSEQIVQSLLDLPKSAPPSLSHGVVPTSVPPSGSSINLATVSSAAGAVVVVGLCLAALPRQKAVAKRPDAVSPIALKRPPIPAFGLVMAKAQTFPLRLKADAVAKEVWGVCVFAVPLNGGQTAIKVGAKSYPAMLATLGGTHFIQIDRMGDGVFTGDDRLTMKAQQMKTKAGEWFESHFVQTRLRTPDGTMLPIGFRTVPDATPTVPEWAGRLVAAPEFAYIGHVKFGKRSMLAGVTTVGSGEDFLSLDRNGNGRAGDIPGEQFRLDEPFNIGGTTYGAKLEFRKGNANLVIAPATIKVTETPLSSNPPVKSGRGPEDPSQVAPVTSVALAKPIPSTQSVEPPAPLLKPGATAPDFTAYKLDGSPVSLHDYKGSVVIVDFWASWCGPCQRSMPGLEKLYGKVKGKGVTVLSVNTWDTQADFQKWIGENRPKYSFEFVRDPAEGDAEAIRRDSIARKLYKAPAIPTMVVIDRKGKIAGTLVGSDNEVSLAKLLRRVGVRP